jgi:thymidine kinase
MNSKLELIIGPMFSGKSTELIRRIRLLKKINKNVLVLKPIIDTRYFCDKITSHNFESVECKVLNRLSEMSDLEISEYHTIVIDEGQFFPDLKDTITKWLESYDINIIVGGLDGDFQKKPIGQILDLIPISNSCIKLNSLCNKCNDGTEAPFTYRIVCSDDTVLVGGSESYIPVCRKHFCELSKDNN